MRSRSLVKLELGEHGAYTCWTDPCTSSKASEVKECTVEHLEVKAL